MASLDGCIQQAHIDAYENEIKPYSRLLVSAERNFILDSAAGSSPTESKARRPQVSGLYL